VHGSLFALGGRGLDPALCAAMGFLADQNAINHL
jgi:hypothetical protein